MSILTELERNVWADHCTRILEIQAECKEAVEEVSAGIDDALWSLLLDVQGRVMESVDASSIVREEMHFAPLGERATISNGYRFMPTIVARTLKLWNDAHNISPDGKVQGTRKMARNAIAKAKRIADAQEKERADKLLLDTQRAQLALEREVQAYQIAREFLADHDLLSEFDALLNVRFAPDYSMPNDHRQAA